MKYRGGLTTKDLLSLIMEQEPNYVLYGKHVTKTIVGDFAVCSWSLESLKKCSRFQLFSMWETCQIYGSKTVGNCLVFESKTSV